MSDKKPLDIVIHPDGSLEMIGIIPEPSPEQLAERKKIIAQCGHVKRRLKRGVRLTDKVLEFALDVLSGTSCGMNESAKSIADKLAAGQKLTDYEMHLMLDVILLHKRLGSS